MTGKGRGRSLGIFMGRALIEGERLSTASASRSSSDRLKIKGTGSPSFLHPVDAVVGKCHSNKDRASV